MKKDNYYFSITGEQDSVVLYRMMAAVSEEIADPSRYILNSLDDVLEHLRHGSFAVVAKDEQGAPAGCLLCYLPLTEQENLGADSFPHSDVLLMDTVVVMQRHRGHRLQERMLRFAEEQLAPGKAYCLMATVSPENIASLRSFQRTGYRILTTKKKYGGYLRHIMYKEWTGR